jgi:hypothetical protein
MTKRHFGKQMSKDTKVRIDIISQAALLYINELGIVDRKIGNNLRKQKCDF